MCFIKSVLELNMIDINMHSKLFNFDNYVMVYRLY